MAEYMCRRWLRWMIEVGVVKGFREVFSMI